VIKEETEKEEVVGKIVIKLPGVCCVVFVYWVLQHWEYFSNILGCIRINELMNEMYSIVFL